MKKHLILAFLLVNMGLVYSQQIYFEVGKSLSTFEYLNSKGEKLENLQSTSHSFLSAGYKNKIFKEKLNGSLGLAYAGYGAIGSDDTVGNFMQWHLNYIELRAGLDFELFKINETAFYVKGTSAAAFLVQGT